MKFSLTSYYAKEFFFMSPTGERLFHLGFFWLKPYIIPNPETENRLFKKTITIVRISFLVCFIFIFLFSFGISQINSFPWLCIYSLFCLLILGATYYIAFKIVFTEDLSKLKQSSSRIPLKEEYRKISSRDSYLSILTRLLGSIAFLIAIFWNIPLLNTFNISLFEGIGITMWAVIGIMTYSLIAWVYILFLKIATKDKNEA